MRILLFITDRYPFGKGEAFIENEMPFLENKFDKLYIIPQALTADVSIKRNLSDKSVIIKPANTNDLYLNGDPTKKERIIWSLKYMLPWIIFFIFSKRFFKELKNLNKEKKFSIQSIRSIIRSGAPLIRNLNYLKKKNDIFDFSENDDIYIYSYWSTPMVIEVDSILKNVNNVKKRISRAHGYDLYNERHNGNYIPFRKQILEGIDELYLISNDGLRYMETNYPSYRNKYKLSYLGTNDFWSGIYLKKDSKLRIVSCSYIYPLKRVYRIINALSLIVDYEIEWTHYGAGQDFEKTKILAHEMLGNKDNIMYCFKGHVSNADLINAYTNNQYDLFINVSESEGLPVSIMEALSFAIPIIGTDVGSTHETIVSGENGLLIPKGFTDEELKNAIISYCIMDNNLFIEQRKNSRCIWVKKYSAFNNYSDFIKRAFDL